MVSYRIFSSLINLSYLIVSSYRVELDLFLSSLFTCCSSFDRIYLSVSLSCRTGSLPLSLHVVLRSTVSIYPSLYRVEPDLFLSLCMLFFVRPYLSIRLSIVSNRIFSSLFACCSSRSTVSIDPSCYCVVPDLFLSLCMLFFVRPYLSIHLVIVLYRIFSSLFKCHFDPFLVLLLRPPTPTDTATPTLLLLWSWN